MVRSLAAPTFAVLCLMAAPAQAQMSDHEGNAAFMDDIARDTQILREKIVGLAEAIPFEKWSWRPGEGIRSIGEVFLHIAADNYYIPAAAGAVPPAWTGIDPDVYMTTKEYEHRDLPREQVLHELAASFDHVDEVIKNQDASRLDSEVTLFGHTYSERGMWILQATHVHEHLGQLIAYARTNGIVPPWSQ